MRQILSQPHLSPIERYQKALKANLLQKNPEQLAVILQLNTLYHHLIKKTQTPLRYFIATLFTPAPPIRYYFHGKSGIGKTLMMDLFYNSLPFAHKKRMHFHSFMRWFHQQLKQHKGHKKPIALVAKDFAQSTCVLCFDEFYVTDITNAMLLGQLLQALIKANIAIIITSNIPANQLYKDGFQRQKFLSTIAMIQAKFNVICFQHKKDYRRNIKHSLSRYFFPLNQTAYNQLLGTWLESNMPLTQEGKMIAVDQIMLHAQAVSNTAVWFKYDTLFKQPLAANAYLALANAYKEVFITDVPQFDDTQLNQLWRWIICIDIFYEANIIVYCTAATAIDQLYQGTKLKIRFMRTASRLQAMQTAIYYPY